MGSEMCIRDRMSSIDPCLISFRRLRIKKTKAPIDRSFPLSVLIFHPPNGCSFNSHLITATSRVMSQLYGMVCWFAGHKTSHCSWRKTLCKDGFYFVGTVAFGGINAQHYSGVHDKMDQNLNYEGYL